MTTGYIICLTAAVGLLIAYSVVVKTKEFWLTMLHVCVSVVNLGYLLMSLANTVEFAVIGNGAAKLVKEYGVLHPFYMVYLLGYFAAMIGTIIHLVRKMKIAKPKLAGFIAAVVFSNLLMWLFEKLVHWEYEFLSVTYVISEFLLLIVYGMLQDYVHKNEVPSPVFVEEKAPIIIVDNMTRAEKIKTILDSLPEDTVLSTRQMDILERILDYKSRKEIAVELHLSANTVKTHTGMLYKALGVSGRDEIYAMFQK